MMLNTKKKAGEGEDLVLCDLVKDKAFIPACGIKMWLAGTADLVLLFPAISCYWCWTSTVSTY